MNYVQSLTQSIKLLDGKDCTNVSEEFPRLTPHVRWRLRCNRGGGKLGRFALWLLELIEIIERIKHICWFVDERQLRGCSDYCCQRRDGRIEHRPAWQGFEDRVHHRCEQAWLLYR